MLKITIESHRHDDPMVTWMIDMLKFKQVPFKKHVITLPKKECTTYQTTIQKVERDDVG